MLHSSCGLTDARNYFTISNNSAKSWNFLFLRNLRKLEHILNVQIRRQKKSSGTGDGRIERNGTVYA